MPVQNVNQSQNLEQVGINQPVTQSSTKKNLAITAIAVGVLFLVAAVIGAVGTFTPLGLGHSVSIAMMASGAVIGLGLIIGGAYILKASKTPVTDSKPTVEDPQPPVNTDPTVKDPQPPVNTDPTVKDPQPPVNLDPTPKNPKPTVKDPETTEPEQYIPSPVSVPDYGPEYTADLSNTIQKLEKLAHVFPIEETVLIETRQGATAKIADYFKNDPSHWTDEQVKTFAQDLLDAYREGCHLEHITYDKILSPETQKIGTAFAHFRVTVWHNKKLYQIYLASSDIIEIINDQKFSAESLRLAINEFKNGLIRLLGLGRPLFNQAAPCNVPDHTDLRINYEVKGHYKKYLETKYYQQIFSNGKTFKDPLTLSTAELKLFARDLTENYAVAKKLAPLNVPSYKRNQLKDLHQAINESQVQYGCLQDDTATQAVCDAANKLQMGIDEADRPFDFISLAVEELRDALQVCFKRNDSLPGSSNSLEFRN